MIIHISEQAKELFKAGSDKYRELCLGKICSAKIIQWTNISHPGRAEVILASFSVEMITASLTRVAYPLKYPNNACLSCLYNDSHCIAV